jgi:hypothetical protein
MRVGIAFFCLVCSLSLPGCRSLPACPETPKLIDLLERSSVVFVGSLVSPEPEEDRSLFSGLTVTPVQVEQIFRDPQTLGPSTGRRVGLQLRPGSRVRPGDRALFFANPVAFGEGITLQEVARFDAREADTLADRIGSAERALADRSLRSRLDQAVLVVVGRVERLALEQDGPGMPGSKHDPEWREALLQVESVVKGSPAAGPVSVRFAGSLDIRWFRSPKLEVGSGGIFLLQAASQAGLPAGAYAVLDPLDVQPGSELNRILSLLRR